MRRTLTGCPVCAEPLEVASMRCCACKTEIHGSFDRCGFCGLEADHAQFIKLFLALRGNVTAVASEMGLSPPTVAKRLDAALESMGLRQPEPQSVMKRPDVREQKRRQILEQLDLGEISADDATRMLRDL